MWSKQADTTVQRDNNKNMTSFRNKITNRKRKTSKPSADQTLNVDKNSKTSSDDPDLASKTKQDGVNISDKKNQPKNNKNRGRNRTKKDANNAQLNNKIATDTVRTNLNNKIDNSDIDIDVVLRHASNGEVVNNKNVNNSLNGTAKRYSDSFVIENEIGHMKIKEDNQAFVPPTLTRACSGFFIIDHARKANRRLSDLFRPSSTLKLSSSVESLKSLCGDKSKAAMEKELLKNSKAASNNKNNSLNSSSSTKSKKGVATPTSKTQSPKVTSKKDTPVPAKDTNSSYLKRVKSKIYKSKSDSLDEVDNNVDPKTRKLKPKKSMDLNGRIPEETEAVLTPNGLRKSLTHFDFRLPRQTSNLERVRPKTYSSKKSDEESEKENIVSKPVMEKSKSSSAINLSLWKSKRNKLMEQMASKTGGLYCSSQDVQNEFDFIAFGSVSNIPRSSLGSQSSLQKQPSWLHIHKAHNEGNFGLNPSQIIFFVYRYFWILIV